MIWRRQPSTGSLLRSTALDEVGRGYLTDYLAPAGLWIGPAEQRWASALDCERVGAVLRRVFGGFLRSIRRSGVRFGEVACSPPTGGQAKPLVSPLVSNV